MISEYSCYSLVQKKARTYNDRYSINNTRDRTCQVMSAPKGDLNAVSTRIRELREAMGLSQTAFAKRVKLTQAAISHFEDGKRIPSTRALQKISSNLGISLDSLLGTQPDEEKSERDDAIQAFADMLKNSSLDKEKIIYLNRFVEDTMVNKDDKDK